MAGKPQPVRVLYCAVCSLPAEYCEFGPDFEKCKPWLIQNAPELYPDLVKGDYSISQTLISVILILIAVKFWCLIVKIGLLIVKMLLRKKRIE